MKIGICGKMGRVGKILISELESGLWAPMEFAGGTASNDDPDSLFEKADAVIDFTRPDATAKHVWLAAKHRTPLIVGTTGLNAAQEREIGDAAKECPIVYAANMSIGVNLILALVEQAAARLGPEWDIEVFETHHRHKVDAPSGTALALGKAARQGRGGGDFVTGDRHGARGSGDIGYAVQRGGDVVGEHMVTFFGAGERIEIGHKASDRALFARGALRAAQWSAGRKPGLYSMRDVLGL